MLWLWYSLTNSHLPKASDRVGQGTIREYWPRLSEEMGPTRGNVAFAPSLHCHWKVCPLGKAYCLTFQVAWIKIKNEQYPTVKFLSAQLQLFHILKKILSSSPCPMRDLTALRDHKMSHFSSPLLLLISLFHPSVTNRYRFLPKCCSSS